MLRYGHVEGLLVLKDPIINHVAQLTWEGQQPTLAVSVSVVQFEP